MVKNFFLVIVTVPVGYLKQFAGQMFSPPLPTSKILALDGIGMIFFLLALLLRKTFDWDLSKKFSV